MTTQEKSGSELAALATLQNICELSWRYDETDTQQEEEEILEEVASYPLSVRVRSGWYNCGTSPDGPKEYELLLSTGGPAVRIIGDLDEAGDPSSAVLQHQDWGTPWQDVVITDPGEQDALTWFAQQFPCGC